MLSQSNPTQEDILLYAASTESPTEIQEIIDNLKLVPSTSLIEDTIMKNIYLPCTFKESPLYVEEVVTGLPSTAAESPSQFRTEPVKRQDTRQGLYCLLKSKVLTSVNRGIRVCLFT
ncbi:uncharacterized protein NPIL_419961 [Nephila pilipes]|uniref:Uncharacterized protein n=1 Tax=Nephila pilipes TaxID=299642 RepID=A0A8X6JCH5_NEPPI|nr:uncharacterized protein NPIL_419961 [Nephila pilipes]